jgi:hypothetical protein
MSLAKAVPKGIKDRECKRFALQERPLVPYVPEKDPIQETAFLLKSDQSLKTTIEVNAELRLPIWHCRTHKAFLIHVSSALDTIKKRGIFKAYKEARKAYYVEQCKAAKQVKAALALFMAPTSKGKKDSKKASGKESLKNSSEKETASEKEPAKKSSEKEKTSKKTKEGVALADAPAPELCDEYQALNHKAIFAKETAKNKKDAAATEMFQFCANLLSLDAKYAWNKIVREQTEADPFKDLQGMSRKGPKGLLRESFYKCVMFHLLTVFPAEQKKYYLSNVLKEPQRVGIRQFIQRVEQLNTYVAQLPCWYYSPSYNAGMMLANVPFSEADLASHILWTHQWQDQYNLQEKGMTSMDMRSLQASLEAIKRVCIPETSHAPSSKKASHKNEARSKQPSNGAIKQAHKKVHFEKSCKLCKKHGGVHITHTTKDCCKYDKDGMAKANFCAAKKVGKKPNPAK